MASEVLHQSIKGKKIACGADITKVKYTPLCDHVTCPECHEWQKALVNAVMAPLEPTPPSPHTELLAQFHKVWGLNKDGVYDKTAWTTLQSLLQATLEKK